MKHRVLIIIVFVQVFLGTSGQNLRQISNREGISNNAVLSLCQDRDGFIWLGTCEGVNIWDGREMYVFDQTEIKDKNLCSNLIEEFITATDSLLWIRTNYGLNKINPRSKKSEMYPNFNGLYKFTVRRSDEVFVATQDNSLFFYNQGKKTFEKIKIEGLNYSNILTMFFDEQDNLWFFTPHNIYYLPVRYGKERIEIGKYGTIKFPEGINHAEITDRKVYFISSTGIFYELNTQNQQIIYKADIGAEQRKRGGISKIISDGDDYYIAFTTNGLIKLKSTPAHRTMYEIESIPINCGIFSLLRDKNQDIIWIGTDGQGLYQYTKGGIVFNSFTYDQLPHNITKPTRVLYVDKLNDLWIGTKDDGIFKIKDFFHAEELNYSNVFSYNTQNNDLLHNSVYTFSSSRRNLFWIGSDGIGLNYYSYKDKKIHKLNTQNPIMQIHGLVEVNDSTLWIVTGISGVFKVIIGGTMDYPTIKKEIPIFIGEEFSAKNIYFSIYQESDSIIWFGNRGGGTIRYNMLNNSKKIIRFNSPNFQAVNDIFAISRSKDGIMWFGTGSGLIRYSPHEKIKSRLLTKSTIHALLMDSKDNLWISTNNGLMKYSITDETIATYDYPYGLKVIEFSDGAFFKDKESKTLFFGGINGFVSIKEKMYDDSPYTPELLFKDIRINNNVYSLDEVSDKSGHIVLKSKQNYFTITVIALDYINGSNYSYQYKIDDEKGSWIENSNSNKFSFSGLKPGNYNLQVRYVNKLANYSSPVYQLKIEILPPWYASFWAKLIYAILILLTIGYIIHSLIKREKKKRLANQKKLEQAQKEEMYESKLRFFSNITQELSTPLTLILGPSQQITGYENSDDYVIDQATTIQQNASKLNKLIYMLNEFKESGEDINSKEEIELLDISQIGNEIAQQFTAHAIQNNIKFDIDIEKNLIWTSNKNRFFEILDSFLSFAFKNTKPGGNVGLTIFSQGDNLTIDVYNTENQTKLDFINLISDRYKVIDYLEKNSRKGISSQASLELAISHNIVKNMGGNVDIQLKNNGNIIIFRIEMPKLELSKEQKTAGQIILPDKSVKLTPVEKKEYAYDKNRPTILLMLENIEIMNFISDIFENQYNIEQTSNIKDANEFLKYSHPNIIICSIHSQLSNLVEFIRNIKEEKQTTHIPIAVLSTSQQKEEQIQVIEAGADICLVLPFDVKYLKAVTEQLLKNSESLKDYYRSSLSSFEMVDGKLLHKEDKELMDKMLHIISNNLTNPAISTEFVANEMGISVRNLYRRLENITDKTPIEIIKDYRLQIAEQLLVTTKLSIDEIVYKSGFNNRGTFFKSFSNKYKTTPKAYREKKSDNSDK